ncbi:MAG: nucleotidyltransferase domain-containing protein [Deltaproteobacteria bacterium]|nr:nucleotidyltransferase domain-containing protein [Deltaproteobacteria bacterium]
MEETLRLIADELLKKHGCHTVVLYGSRALDAHESTSDFDVAGVREAGEPARDARPFEGEYLDAFIYPEKALETLEPEMIRLRAGRVLVEKDGYGTRLIERARKLFDAGPKPLSEAEASLIRSWVAKTLARISRGGPEDVEANYRRVWLLFQLLEDHFKLRGQWYLGPRESFEWLRRNDPATYRAFEQALAPEAARGSLRVLAARVLGE